VLSDCKRIAKGASPSRVREVIKKANRQIKVPGICCYGLVVIDLSEIVPMYDLDTLSNGLPPELDDYNEEAVRSLQRFYSSVTAAVLLWNELSILGHPDRPGRVNVTLRTRSKVVQHERPKHPFDSELDISRIECVGTISTSILVSPSARRDAAPKD